MAGIAPQIYANPTLSRNAIWSYTTVQAGPVRGPQPRLAQGSGLTGDPASPGTAAYLPGYMSDQEYFPTTFEYDTDYRPDFQEVIPRSIHTGENGREMVGTYEPHDFTPAVRQLSHMRQADYWQVQDFPPNVRNLLAWQQVQRYRVNSLTLSPRPLDQSQYFLGYQINPQVASAIGQSGLGSMGSQ